MKPDEQELIEITPLQKTIERLLTDYHQTPVVLERSTLLTNPARRNRIWRCHLKASAAHVPETVIIKQVKPDGYAPADPASWDTSRFFRDWAGAQFLSAFMREEGHGPAFYGGDVEQGFIVLEDMGEHMSLVAPLLEGDAASANHALLAFARRLGRMHASSVGKEEFYREIQRQISPAWAAIDGKSPEGEREERGKRVGEFTDICTRLGVEAGEDATQDLIGSLTRSTDPGPFKTFIHGDPCPDNVFYRAPELRLIDFEFSSFGHALRDGLYGRWPFPTCWCANAVPAEVLQQMETAYRTELSVACSEVLDEARFAEAASAIAVCLALDVLRWELEGALKQDDSWGIAGTRARILSRIAMFLDLARTAHQLPALCEVYEKILVQLQNRWPEAAPLPVSPAFRTEATA